MSIETSFFAQPVTFVTTTVHEYVSESGTLCYLSGHGTAES